MFFALDLARRDGWQIVSVSGELELATAPKLRQQVVSLVGTDPMRLVIDLTNVDFIDSVGLGVVVGALKRVRASGGELRVVAVGDRVRPLFALTRLDEIIDVVATLDDALAAPPQGESHG